MHITEPGLREKAPPAADGRRGSAAVMNDQEATIARLKELVRDFSRRRDWEQFHHPKDLGVALAIEVGELLEHFR